MRIRYCVKYTGMSKIIDAGYDQTKVLWLKKEREEHKFQRLEKKVQAQLGVAQQLGDTIAISGGMAIHLLSPLPHRESREGHDHKDLDVFVLSPRFFQRVKQLGFTRWRTRYDRTDNFYRYGRTVPVEGVRVKIIIDAFVSNVPTVKVAGFTVVHPRYLASLYEQGALHSGTPDGQEYKKRQVIFLRSLSFWRKNERKQTDHKGRHKVLPSVCTRTQRGQLLLGLPSGGQTWNRRLLFCGDTLPE